MEALNMEALNDVRLVLVGCGKMGGAMLEGWLAGGLKAGHVRVVEPPARHAALRQAYGTEPLADATGLKGFAPDVVVFAVKPQITDTVLPDYAPLAGAETVFLSVAAGRRIAALQERLGPEARIVRAMPNTPAAIGAGVSVLCATPKVSDAQRRLCQGLLDAVGTTAWVEDEAHLDAVTALSGSGPAYVFHLVEALSEAGMAAGLPADLAGLLARRTVVGAGALLDAAGEDAATLRENVTSPGGTTAAALTVLMDREHGLAALMRRAVAAAKQRSIDLQ